MAGRRSEVRRRHSRRLRGSTAKRWLVLGFDRASRRVPDVVLRAGLSGMFGAARLSWPLPRHPLRIACQDVALLARSKGHTHAPRAIYDRLLDQIHAAAHTFLAFRRRGRAAVIERIDLAREDVLRLEGLLEQYGGVVVAVSHNVGAVSASVGLQEVVPTLVVVKGQKDPQREALARDFFEQAGVEALLVRDLQATTLARTCLRALREGRALVATLDLLYRKPNGLAVRMFGEPVAFAPWAFRFAARQRVPLLPGYVRIDAGRVHAEWGEPIVDDSLERLAEHYARFLETWILKDPGSWAFLGDKRWRRVLRSAASREPA